MSNVLVTGGAGYIGSHVTKNLLKDGESVVVIDDLSTGFIEPINLLKNSFSNLEFIKTDLANKEEIKKVLEKKKIDYVMHFAAKVSVPESLKKPDLYYQTNFVNGVNLIEAMSSSGINNLIFSSSCVVYGKPQYIPIDENHPTNPESPYGQTKLDFEKYLETVKNLNYIIFRYFNVGGSDPDGLLGKADVNRGDILANLINVALGKQETFRIYGTDYDTKDGTPVRDFLHVEDISQAHISAMKKLAQNNKKIFNLGTGNGFTIKEIVKKGEEIFEKTIPQVNADRLEGDIPVSVAVADKAKLNLGWQPKYSDLKTIIKTDWDWRKKHPSGY